MNYRYIICAKKKKSKQIQIHEFRIKLFLFSRGTMGIDCGAVALNTNYGLVEAPNCIFYYSPKLKKGIYMRKLYVKHCLF